MCMGWRDRARGEHAGRMRASVVYSGFGCLEAIFTRPSGELTPLIGARLASGCRHVVPLSVPMPSGGYFAGVGPVPLATRSVCCLCATKKPLLGEWSHVPRSVVGSSVLPLRLSLSLCLFLAGNLFRKRAILNKMAWLLMEQWNSYFSSWVDRASSTLMV